MARRVGPPAVVLFVPRALRLRPETPVRRVFYPGAGHRNRRAAAPLDYALGLMRWMNHSLTGPGGEPSAVALPQLEALRDGDRENATRAGPAGR